mmetsp:Transcript_96901/g.278315  ORF Transcript_96901/g.278315 Transcript_96901/m.278315 type:complete len:379 (+) Transcript_96901:84-1220(+)|eukprot:CAMPEP_0177194256 /NCGR_PEP_ID=MMETSP0367-20130122/22881_1 /TAXON_ID=447022 ORGANISM="Scrippsiella hangoei-like, Strain SHHI-4" /NCGR_SAMPLE_ID=MMETSP0367 /ASSEMBLY_ACC=CAM_ASM_000362 /LENGTH=378 /DNA_ID=CAMNT_0018642201 /DNA_START=34 /DNA_END=1170 /DNA_ORIENTATION=-
MADTLPPNWSRYTDDAGKEYFHNASTNMTQWDKPAWNGQAPESLSFHSGTSEVYEYRPTVSDLELNTRNSDAGGKTVAMVQPPASQADRAGTSVSSKVPSPDLAEVVSLNRAPGGRISESSTSSTTNSSSSVAGGAGGGPGAFGVFGGGSFVGGVMGAAFEDDGGDRMSGIAGSALAYAQTYFEVSSDDVVKRLRLSLLPYTTQPSGDAANDFRARPDFWGPFWIATTAVLFLAATGNFARMLQMEDRTVFKADYGLISLAAMMVYGCLIGVPLLLRAVLFFTGHEPDTINFRQMICVYGYSLSPTVPASIICILPLDGVRWLAVLVGLGISLAFIRGNLWMDLAIEAPSLKWKMMGLFCTAQASIFLVYRIHFFSSA